jgi:hypothetical protein
MEPESSELTVAIIILEFGEPRNVFTPVRHPEVDALNRYHNTFKVVTIQLWISKKSHDSKQNL